MPREKISKNPTLIILISLLIILIIITSGVYLYKSAKKMNSNQSSENNQNSQNDNSNQNKNQAEAAAAERERQFCFQNLKNGTALITITTPGASEVVHNPFTVGGKATAFENEFNIRIKDCQGTILTSKVVSTDSTEVGVAGKYSATFNLNLGVSETNIIIEAYDVSMKDGAEENLVQVPVRVAK